MRPDNLSIDRVEPDRPVRYLFDTHRILATPIIHSAVRGVRIMPNVNTTPLPAA